MAVSRREFLIRTGAAAALGILGGSLLPLGEEKRMTLGLNILGDRGVPNHEIVNQVRQLNAHYNLVMNNVDLTKEVAPYCRKGVIFRWWENDDNVQDRTDPREFVRFRHNLIREVPDALLYLGNEPWATQKLADWTYEVMDECEKLGRRGVILNFSTGNPEPSVLPLFRNVFARAIDMGHVLGLHEYFSRDWRNDYPWHVGRFLEIHRFLNGRIPETIMTEIGEARDYHPLRGYRWGSDALSDETYGRHLREMAQLYNEYGINALVFARTSEKPEDDWRTFNPRPRVIEIMAAYNAGEKPVEKNYPTLPASNDKRWAWWVASANNLFVNVRSTPVVAGVKNKVGEIRIGTPIKIIMDNTASYDDGVGTWRPVMLPDGTRGWARDDVFTLKLIQWEERELESRFGNNLRRTPNGSVIRVLQDGEVVGVVFPGEPITAGGYEWALVKHRLGDIGWVARTQPTWGALFLALIPTDAVILDVPYASQWGHASGRTAMCGAASAWMVVAADRSLAGIRLPKEITVDSIADHLGLGKSTFATTVGIEKALRDYGVPAKFTLELSLDKIREEIDKGFPVLVLFDYGHISQRKDKGFTVGHFVVAVGYDADNIIFHDPDYTDGGGKYVRYKNADVEKALSQTTFSGNRPNQGLIIRQYPEPEF